MGCVASIDRLALFFTASEVLLSEVLLRKSLSGLINVCERKNVGFHSGAPASAGQAGAGPGSEFEVFCSTEFGFAAPGGLGGRENVKIIIMQPQIKSPRFINTSSSVRKLGSAPQQMYESNIFLWRFFVVS